jgi:hypothetical protein
MLDEEKSRLRIELAQILFKEYYASCFWHWKPDLIISESMIPAVVRRLCAHGSRKAMLAAAGLHETEEGPRVLQVGVLPGTLAQNSEGVHGSVFQFFPLQPDAEFGYCLHTADLATNKALALAGRAEVRDFIDILFLHETYLSLGAICWAACGKDQGFTPRSLLDFAKRHMKFRAEDLARENLARPISLVELKEAWLKAADQAEHLFARLPLADVGCLYLTPSFQPVTPDSASPDFAKLIRHFGSIRGAWPARGG